MDGTRPTESRSGASSRGPLAFIAGGLLGAAATALGVVVMRPAPDADLGFYRTVREIVQDDYVREVDRDQLLTAAVEGLVTSLDPYSRFYTGERLRQVEDSTRGTFRGIGAVFAGPAGDGRVLFPLPDSPAERAGLGVGDQILSFDGQVLAELEPGQFQERLRALDARPIQLEVRHPDQRVATLELTPAQVIDPTVRHAALLADHVGYVAITSFSRQTLVEFDTAIAELLAAGADALLLDLRGNPGGVLHAATAIANRFIDSGTLLITETRRGHEELAADPEAASLLGTPLVVLVDSGSASASEVLAGALQDARRAALVGTATYGKGTIQTLTPMHAPESILKVTTGFYATPSGRSIDRFYRSDGGSAIWPDLEVELDEAALGALHTRLIDYSPPLELAEQVATLERSLGRTPTERVSHDEQLDAALALFAPRDAR